MSLTAIPSYLFALAVGDLQFRELGPRTGLYAEPSMVEDAAWEFAENEEQLRQAEQLLGPYLWDRYDLLIMPPSFPYGGMENPRLTFVTPAAVVGDRSMTPLIAHELAHAWTGNLVTNATWEDFWLNEGWTTYAQYRISEVIEGQESAYLSDLLSRQTLQETIEMFGADSDLTCLKFSMKGVDPDEAISGVPYTKGRLFLACLEESVGRQAFDEFIHKYIARHPFQSLDTEGFVDFLKAELPEAAQRVDLQTWLYRPGMPIDLPEVTSRLMEQVQAALTAYEEGSIPTEEQVRGWNLLQKESFLFALPKGIPVEQCRSMEEVFDILSHPHPELQLLLYRQCIWSGYRDALPGIESFVNRIGRHAWLTFLLRAMLETEWSKGLARPMFERARQRYHPITASVLDHLLQEAGV